MSIIETLLEQKKKRVLQKIARHDFEDARGTAHAKLLKESRETKLQELRYVEKQISKYQKERQKIYDQDQKELLRALERHLVFDRLNEVPGIGQKYHHELATQVFRTSITDLRRANQIPGIGENKQYEIDKWISYYQSQIPEMIKKDFPGKAEIVKNSIQIINEIDNFLIKMNSVKKELEEKIKSIDTVLTDLCHVSVNDFINLRLAPEQKNPKVDQYLIGLFPEWEPMPDWFKNLM